ncbi:TMV resistance protein N-like [Eucalyptus grandis]|uniref:TMV resistance protein N-like n=1 Tax=Eucalyptus grandis TaxID=71139 RepID=UPI00192F06C2|nr:TMV resistance protein N-like [Eucalyptus grandis]
MGRDIVNEACRDDPGKRSRLWLLEDVEDIFCCNTIKVVYGTDAVEAIVLDFPPPEVIIINPDAFTNMKKLRILILLRVHISSQAQNFSKLKSINFSECKSLVSIHDLSSAPNMEKLILNRCESLVEVHPSVGYLVKLKVLSLELCSNLRNFPNTLKTKSLETLELRGCSKLEKFPDIDGKMEHLKRLDLRGIAIKELPASIENLVSVELMDLAFCKNLMRLPSHIYKLQNLEYFNLESCLNLITFPKNMEDSTDPDGHLGFRKLVYLKLDWCNLSEVQSLESFSNFLELKYLRLQDNKFAGLPTCINKYYRLKSLIVDGCELLQEIPQLPPNIDILSADRCKSLQKLPDLWGQPSHIGWVSLASCCELFHKGINMDDVANVSLLEKLPKMKDDVDIVLIGREMPKWILPCEEDSISFMVPRDLYDKLKGLAFCVVLSPEEGKVVRYSCDFKILVNGQTVMEGMRYFFAMESDHVCLSYWLKSCKDGLPKDWSHFQLCLRAEKGSIKKRGLRLICEQREDDLRVVFPTPSTDRNKLEFSRERYSKDNFQWTSPVERDGDSLSLLTKKILIV